MNRLCAQFLSAGRPLVVCTTRNLKLRVIQYLVTLFCPGRQRVWPQGFSPSAAPWGGHWPLALQAVRQTRLYAQAMILFEKLFRQKVGDSLELVVEGGLCICGENVVES